MRPGLLAPLQARGQGLTAVEQASPVVRRRGARLFRKVYEVDPLTCPRCGGPMRVSAVIERPNVVEHILSHLGVFASVLASRPPSGIAR